MIKHPYRFRIKWYGESSKTNSNIFVNDDIFKIQGIRPIIIFIRYRFVVMASTGVVFLNLILVVP